MGLKPARHAKQAQSSDRPEDQTVRQYRYLLRTAPSDALEAAHVDALSAIGRLYRDDVLRTVQTELVAGAHINAADVGPLAHMVTLWEPALSALAQAVIDSEPAFGLFGGYASWDGVDPAPADERDDSEYAEQWHAARATRDGTAPGLNGAFGGT